MNILLVGCAKRTARVQIARNVVNSNFAVLVRRTHPTRFKVRL
jgi:hypothetical protein